MQKDTLPFNENLIFKITMGRKQKQKQSSEKKAKFGVSASNKATLNMSRY